MPGGKHGLFICTSLLYYFSPVQREGHIYAGLDLYGLAVLMMPVGATTASCLGVLERGSRGVTWFHACQMPYVLIVPVFLAVLVVYYLVLEYIVGFLNRVLGIT